MIPREDLRVGNYVQETIHFVEGNSGFTVTRVVMPRQLMEKTNGLEPIPLTQKWLEALGFCKWPDVDDWSRGRFNIHGRKWANNAYVIRKHMPPIKYVHQLQNAYKVFTGKELYISEEITP